MPNKAVLESSFRYGFMGIPLSGCMFKSSWPRSCSENHISFIRFWYKVESICLLICPQLFFRTMSTEVEISCHQTTNQRLHQQEIMLFYVFVHSDLPMFQIILSESYKYWNCPTKCRYTVEPKWFHSIWQVCKSVLLRRQFLIPNLFLNWFAETGIVKYSVYLLVKKLINRTSTFLKLNCSDGKEFLSTYPQPALRTDRPS